MRIALAQINPTVGDLAGNKSKILSDARRAFSAGADLVLFPELALTGYPPEDLLLKPRFVADNVAVLKELARELRGGTAVVGFVEAAADRLCNSAAVLSGGRVVGTYRKQALPNYGVFDEKRYFSPGSRPLLLEAAGCRMGLTICEDIWAEGPYVRGYRPMGIDLLLNLSASPFHTGKLSQRHVLIARRARECGAPVAYCNLVGGQDELVFDGGSLVMEPGGRLLANAPQFRESLLFADLPARSGRRRGDRRFRALKAGGAVTGEKPPLTPLLTDPLESVDEVQQALILGTRDYAEKNGFSKVALGLSGGVDSALVAALAVKALGGGRVVGVTMPSHYTSRETFHDSKLLAHNLGIQLITLPIETIVESFGGTLSSVFAGLAPDVTEENIQARIRGTLLMALSNKFGWLILTTGNKSEVSTGYCTLYGDTAGGFAVIKDVPKTLVYELARRMNDESSGPLIPPSILTRAPTAELKPNQKDQDSLPPYPVLDRILKAYVEEDKSLADIVRSGAAQAVARKVVRLVDLSEYKRRQAPPGIKITPKAFGRDRRMPLTNLYRT